MSPIRTVEVTRFGGPEVLELRERPDPVPAPGQVVIDVAAIPLLWLDTALRSGHARGWFSVEPPYVPGNGVAGTVADAGAGVDPSWVGRRVISDTRGVGSYAERVAVPAAGLVAIPDGLPAHTAAALLTDGRTALGLLEAVRIEEGTPVLITGAAGGMGLLLVQLATARRVRVVGAARGEAKLAAVRANGASAVDYSQPGWTVQVREALDGEPPAIVLDGVGGRFGAEALAILADGGTFSAHGAASGEFAPHDEQDLAARGISLTGISAVQFPPGAAAQRMRDVLGLAAAGRLAPHVGRTYPFERAAEAHRDIEARQVIGKALLLTR